MIAEILCRMCVCVRNKDQHTNRETENNQASVQYNTTSAVGIPMVRIQVI
jgi:hypothetical protein